MCVCRTEAGTWPAASTRRQHVCGAPLFPPEHELYSKVVVREDAECTTVIEPLSYSARCGYPKICYVCGHKSPLAITAAMLERYQTVHPVCSACQGKGCVERTRGEKKGKKRKHDEGLFVLFWWIGVLFPPLPIEKCDFWNL